MLHNPILPGFQPDPAICRVGDDYYIATSTFEWYPGVQIHHSRDLKHWRLVDRPLCRPDLLSMEGNLTADGIFAPCLTHDGEKFWLAYSDCKTRHGRWIDINNYVTWTTEIGQSWSERVYQHSAGIDVSYFHDDDGRSYLLSNLFTPLTEGMKFRSVLMQEVDRATGSLRGEAQVIYPGTELNVTEGPHIYKVDGWYFIVCAEGGTGGGHAVTIARSREVWGPYETHPDNPILTARDNREWPLQRTGHASWVETQHGEWYMPFLCSRQIGPDRRSPLGRETAIEQLRWDEDGWPRMMTGSKQARLAVPSPQGLAEHPWPPTDDDPEFQLPHLASCWMWLREPETTAWLDLEPGCLRLHGRMSFHSRFEQSLIGRRQTAHACEISTRLQFFPKWDNQLAGLMYRYDEYGFYDLAIGWDTDQGRVLRLLFIDDRQQTVLAQVTLDHDDAVELRMTVNHADGQAWWRRHASDEWQEIGSVWRADVISDEYQPAGMLRFTGAMFALHAQDQMGTRLPAEFSWCRYQEITNEED